MNTNWLQRSNLVPCLIFVVATICYFFIYLPQTYNFTEFILDDNLILTPVKAAKNFFDIYKHDVVDIQPIRDFSYWVDLKLQPMFYFNTFKMTNLLVWYFSFLLIAVFIHLYCSTFNLTISRNAVIIISVFILLHPAMSIPVAWVSARKHLLAFFFILITSVFHLLYIKKRELKFILLTSIFLILSVASHTIYCLWPLWATFTLYQLPSEKFRKRDICYGLLLLFLGFSAGAGNYLYYKTVKFKNYMPSGIHVKYSLTNITNILYAFGCYFINLIDFSGASIYYEAKTLRNGLGATFFVTMLYFLFINFKSLVVRNLLVLMFISCATFTFFLLGTFTSNTYSLFLNIVLLISGYFLYLKYFSKKIKSSHLPWIFLSIFTVELIYTFYNGALWTNNLKIISSMKDKEDVPDMRAWFISELAINTVYKKNYDDRRNLELLTPEIFELKQYLNNGFSSAVANHIMFKAFNSYLFILSNNSKIKPEVKLNIIERICDGKVVYCNYFYGTALYEVGRYKESMKAFDRLLIQIKQVIDTDIIGSKENAAANWGFFIAQMYNLKLLEKDTKKNLDELNAYIFKKNFTEIIDAMKNNSSFICPMTKEPIFDEELLNTKTESSVQLQSLSVKNKN